MQESIDRAKLRRRCGLSQDRLARLVGTSQGAISRWEAGYLDLSPDVVGKIAKLLTEELACTREFTSECA